MRGRPTVVGKDDSVACIAGVHSLLVLEPTPHWLLVRQRVDFKISLYSPAPPHLVSLLTPVTAISARRHGRSALTSGDLDTPRTENCADGFGGPRSFSAAAGPRAWNSLPPELKNTSLSIGQFTSGQLKTLYYASAQPS